MMVCCLRMLSFLTGALWVCKHWIKTCPPDGKWKKKKKKIKYDYFAHMWPRMLFFPPGSVSNWNHMEWELFFFFSSVLILSTFQSGQLSSRGLISCSRSDSCDFYRTESAAGKLSCREPNRRSEMSSLTYWLNLFLWRLWHHYLSLYLTCAELEAILTQINN